MADKTQNGLKVGPNGTWPVGLPTFTVATLPTGFPAGALAYATNALKASETTGNGTGNVVFFDGTAWRRVDTGATAAA